jgi:hypothetical protein
MIRSCSLASSLSLLLASTALAVPLPIAVTQRPNVFGVPEFSVQVQNLVIFINRGTLVAPDGTIFSGLGGPGPSFVDGLTFSEVQSLITGEWTMNDRFGVPFEPVPSTPPFRHVFTVSGFTTGDVFTEVPLITTPADNSTVPETFNLEWEWPSGTTPPSGSFAAVGGSSDVDFVDTGLTSYQLTVNLPSGETQRSVTVFAGSSEDLSNFISPAVSLDAGAVRTFEPRLTFRSSSVGHSLTVVPEPKAAVLAASLLCLTVGWRRLR